ncbi:hypothetical protein F5051DRAFT_432608 [Lentinula edodes]|uniref:uncharacterized protein n=1 Tax=Lentinula edodes TaxID=5353 RepID=UPI001E8E6847|nr:uncharacterized protein C8R40DRAFT_1074459 [Lentinula edodes]XP_046084815.1 uncharacterized protein C8R40DRAFT_1070595 [Lentinula edodes]KAH7868989.1 hypothetical protein C8R40DRAFT_1074459 [Lentinula edodes]KAH7873721.1 hypothetical protein C8R40DRAFT_1070595 [Lentinula edodes]KAJ3872950.1 hypothetical protein F5051DRAFT_432608 [Lentinula edodes]KAJ3923430.1 hypothetical protein F5877DRAFT_63238 [Lentinula edodes]
MARRSSRILHALYTSKRSRVPSPADGPGFLYAFVDSDVYWKVGMTSDYDRRKAEWDRQCPCPSRVWLPPVRVVWRRKAGASADLASTALTVRAIMVLVFPASRRPDICDTSSFGFLDIDDV